MFVKERLLPGEGCVYLSWYYFRLTQAEVTEYESGNVDVLNDRIRPVELRRRMYKIPDYCEPRMFRYRDGIQWPSTASFPRHAGRIAENTIPIRHYPHRDPLQMEKRYRLRAAMMKYAGPQFAHWRVQDWRTDLMDFNSAMGVWVERSGSGEGLSAVEGHTAGGLKEWLPGTQLPEIQTVKHLRSRSRRVIQKIIYPSLVRVLDRLSTDSNCFEPSLLDENINRTVAQGDEGSA